MTGETIVITRPQGDEHLLAGLLHDHGYRIIHEPLTHIFLYHTQRQALHRALIGEPDAVIVTSRHAVQAMALLTDMRDAYLICVGDATARAAYSLGFDRISISGGNAQSLIDTVLAGYDRGSRFLYLSGQHVQAEIDAILAEKGMHAEKLTLYEATAATHLSDTLLEQLRRGHIDGVTFLSQRTATIFMQLLYKADSLPSLVHARAFCLSAAIAATLRSPPWKSIHAAGEATLASLLECVDNTLQR